MQRFQNTKYAYDINIGVHSIMISKTGPGNSNSCYNIVSTFNSGQDDNIH